MLQALFPVERRHPTAMSYIKSAALEKTGFVILDRYDQAADPAEWLELEYVDWKSSGDSRFAPLTSADGRLSADGFWNHQPPRTDKDGVWVESQVAKAPRLKARAEEPGANVGRCRVIELQPNSYASALYNLHQDDNNRLNPDETGWVVRGYYNLSDDPESVMILREERFDPSTEVRIPLPAGTQLIIDTQRFWHAVWHQGNEPRFALITSWESGPTLDAYIAKYDGTSAHVSPELPEGLSESANAEVKRRLSDRSATLADQARAQKRNIAL